MPQQPGWYPDPAKPDAARWWDGNGWTSHVRSATPPPATVGHGTLAPAAVPGWAPPQPVAPAFPQPSSNALSRNSLSIGSMLLTVLLVAAVFTGGVLWLGFIPLVLAIVGYKLHERLAVPALTVAVLGLVINVIVVTS